MNKPFGAVVHLVGPAGARRWPLASRLGERAGDDLNPILGVWLRVGRVGQALIGSLTGATPLHVLIYELAWCAATLLGGLVYIRGHYWEPARDAGETTSHSNPIYFETLHIWKNFAASQASHRNTLL